MRCPKCGKMLDSQTTACPVCQTRIPADRHTAPSRFTSPSQPTSTQSIPPQPAPGQFTPPPQPAPSQFTPPPQPHNKFCSTCGAELGVNAAFCPRCGTVTSQNVNRGTNIGAKLLSLSYSVYVMLATNLFLAFTTLLNFLVYSPSAEDYWKDGMRADVKYSFWELSSAIWKSYKAYKQELDSFNRSNFEYRIYRSEPSFNYWSIIVVILMYAAAFVCAVFVIRAFAKAYSNINSNNPSSLSVLSNLRISSVMAVVQAVLLIILKIIVSEDLESGKHEGVLSFSFWFYIIVIFAIGSLIAEIFLIKANGTSDKGYI